jgi:hypothetical protein
VINQLLMPYALSVKLRDFTVWHQTWRNKRVNCAVLTDKSAGLRTVLSSCLSHRELHSFLSLHANTTVTLSKGTQQNWQQKLTNLMEKLCCAREHWVQFFVNFFFTQFNVECVGPFMHQPLYPQYTVNRILHGSHICVVWMLSKRVKSPVGTRNWTMVPWLHSLHHIHCSVWAIPAVLVDILFLHIYVTFAYVV